MMNETDFYMLILYPATFWILLVLIISQWIAKNLIYAWSCHLQIEVVYFSLSNWYVFYLFIFIFLHNHSGKNL